MCGQVSDILRGPDTLRTNPTGEGGGGGAPPLTVFVDDRNGEELTCSHCEDDTNCQHDEKHPLTALLPQLALVWWAIRRSSRDRSHMYATFWGDIFVSASVWSIICIFHVMCNCNCVCIRSIHSGGTCHSEKCLLHLGFRCDIDCAPCGMDHALCNMDRAPCDMDHALFNMDWATCPMDQWNDQGLSEWPTLSSTCLDANRVSIDLLLLPWSLSSEHAAAGWWRRLVWLPWHRLEHTTQVDPQPSIFLLYIIYLYWRCELTAYLHLCITLQCLFSRSSL